LRYGPPIPPDISETSNVAAKNPDALKRLLVLADKCRGDLGDTIVKREGNGVRPAGLVK